MIQTETTCFFIDLTGQFMLIRISNPDQDPREKKQKIAAAAIDAH